MNCPPQIVNPRTNRCVNRDSAKGRQVLRYYSPTRITACPSKVRNPATGRCVFPNSPVLRRRRSVRRMNSPCPRGKIRNPATGICVKRNGKIGRQLLGTPTRRKNSPCPRGKILNPATGICVKRNGKIGRQLLNYSKPEYIELTPFPKIEVEFNSLAHPSKNIDSVLLAKYGPLLPENFNATKVLGSGIEGVVVALNRNRSTSSAYAMKIFNGKMPNVNTEIAQLLSSLGAAPTLYGILVNDRGFRAIVMGRVDGVLSEYLRDRRTPDRLKILVAQLMQLIDHLCRAGVIHADFHWANIGYELFGKEGTEVSGSALKVIDFGHSIEAPCFPEIELAQLLRTLNPVYGEMNEFNRVYLRDALLAKFNELPNVRPLEKNYNAFEKRYNELFDKHIITHFR